MDYYIGQGCGIAVMVLGIIYPLCRQKKWMLILSVFVNALAGANMLLLGQFGSAIFLNGIAVVHILITLWHFLTDHPIRLWEKIGFVSVYVALGLFGAFSAPTVELLEFLPVLAVIPFGISVFVRDEQNTRKLMLINLVLWMIYYIAVGSTMVLAQAVSVVTTVIGLIKYRKKVDVK